MKPIVIMFALQVILVGCATTSTPESEFPGKLSGVWGESTEDCEANPHTISFSLSGDRMYVRYPEGGTADGATLQERFEYNVLSDTARGLHVALSEEGRLDPTGFPVTWELIYVSMQFYCWRRSDWGEDECTPPRMRCEP